MYFYYNSLILDYHFYIRRICQVLANHAIILHFEILQTPKPYVYESIYKHLNDNYTI